LRGKEELGLGQEELNILEKEKFYGSDFLILTIEDFRKCGLRYGPALRLAEFIKETSKCFKI
jgi:hypothetical protein